MSRILRPSRLAEGPPPGHRFLVVSATWTLPQGRGALWDLF